ncbi:PAS domain-containing protein [candidate division KSB1 bacterium]
MESDFLGKIINSMPVPVFLVDEDLRIEQLNDEAEKFAENKNVLKNRTGNVLKCINAQKDDNDCGLSEACNDCVIRNSVKASIDGNKITKERHVLQKVEGENTIEKQILISSSSIEENDEKYAILVIEDITELLDLKKLIPICSNCKKIKNDENYWQMAEDYIETHTESQLTHGICTDCFKTLYPDLHKSASVRKNKKKDKK